MLNCVTGKGLMNRAHAYKASVDQNTAKGVEPDDGVTMGLFSYPVLMAADILMFNAHKVPVGRDQIQHLEMARDIAQLFNHLYGQGQDFFVLPEVQIAEEVATLPGLDGRKMSKSYDNTIPLFEGGAKAKRAAVMRIVTDSRQPGEPKDAEGSHLFTLYRAFATPEESAAFRQALEEGLGWGDAKNQLFERIEQELGPMRDRYTELMADPARIEDILQAGAEKARRTATPLMQRLREAVGIRSLLQQVSTKKTPAAGKSSGKTARFVSFRDESGFRFRFLAADGQQLFLSNAFANPREGGETQKRLPVGVVETKPEGQDTLQLVLDGQSIAVIDAANWPLIQDALAELRASKD